MHRASKSALASLLVMTVLAAPSAALASTLPAAAMDAPASTMPAPAPAKGGEGLVAPKVTRDEAIAIAKKLFTIPAELGQPNVGISQSQDSAIWSLEWQSSSKQPEQKQISVTVDAVTGTIYRYYTWSSQANQSLQLSFTRDEAQIQAQEWFNKLVPVEHRASLRVVESPLNASYWGGATYQFQWVREINGYPLTGNGVQISVDARSGEVREYSLNWQPRANYTVPEQVLSPGEAEAAYQKNLPMVLQYQRFTKRGTDEAEWRLVYRPLTDSFPRMNQEGALIGWDGQPLDLEALTRTTLVPASEKPYHKPAKPLEQAEALAIARAITGQTGAPSQSSYSEYGEEVKRSAWDFAWTIEGTENQPRTEQRVRIDAETGLVTELSHWTETKPFEQGEKVPVSLEQAQQQAIEFLRTHRPDLAGNLQLRYQADRWAYRSPDYQPTEYYIPFQLLRDGVVLSGRDLQVTVNARTGEVQNFWSGWWDEKPGEEFPAADPKLSADEAITIFLAQQGIEASWATFWSPKTQAESEPALVWQPGQRLSIQSIDARSGAPLDWDGRNLIEAQRYPSDIKGHAAEREIELLWARGVFDLDDGKFRPNAAVTADDLAKWIVLARGYSPYMAYDFVKAEAAAGTMARAAAQSTNSAYFGAALQNGIILPEELATLKSLQGSVPRELFALWSARAMGYSRIVKMDARIAMTFIDQDQIDAKYQNAVALLSGLGVIAGDFDNKFNPKVALTRAEAAKILFAVSAEVRY